MAFGVLSPSLHFLCDFLLVLFLLPIRIFCFLFLSESDLFTQNRKQNIFTMMCHTSM